MKQSGKVLLRGESKRTCNILFGKLGKIFHLWASQTSTFFSFFMAVVRHAHWLVKHLLFFTFFCQKLLECNLILGTLLRFGILMPKREKKQDLGISEKILVIISFFLLDCVILTFFYIIVSLFKFDFEEYPVS